MTIDDGRTGPDFTIVASGSTGLLDRWVLARRRGGRLVRVTVPLMRSTPGDVDAAVAAALASIPDYPSPDAY